MRLLIWCSVLTLTLLAPRTVIAAEDEARMIIEAKSIMSQLRSEAPDPEKCLLSDHWSDLTLPEHYVQKYFGLTIHANLAPPYVSVEPSEILGLSPANSIAYCTDKEAKDYREMQRRVFASNNEKQLTERTWIFTFPKFDKDLKTAVVITLFSQAGLYKNETGIHNQSFELATEAHIFRKSKGIWREIDKIILEIT